ncbi:hypothetical protein PMO01_09005 [Pseudomonas moraviensis R28-S]|jgi:hypothetical protein|uniref:Uncharacterized protein n=1 Tax=Pseudomonas moraviensis R28-S TaxID=1395516 RepID=V8REW9_9PSED|nr:hypothetical protein PMO01_09005 [Pseudomonas moraviensis R28-S]
MGFAHCGFFMPAISLVALIRHQKRAAQPRSAPVPVRLLKANSGILPRLALRGKASG